VLLPGPQPKSMIAQGGIDGDAESGLDGGPGSSTRALRVFSQSTKVSKSDALQTN
jgi:hypothetical protein